MLRCYFPVKLYEKKKEQKNNTARPLTGQCVNWLSKTAEWKREKVERAGVVVEEGKTNTRRTVGSSPCALSRSVITSGRCHKCPLMAEGREEVML